MRAVKKYGKENFVPEVLDYVHGEFELDLMECVWIARHNAIKDPMFYNIRDGGNNMDELARAKIASATKGRTAYNKGKPNPIAKERMLNSNPMKDPDVVKKVMETKRAKGPQHPSPHSFLPGCVAYNRIEATYTFQCEQCGCDVTQRDTKKNRKDRSRFCGKGCAQKWRNLNTVRRKGTGRPKGVRETKPRTRKDQNSQPKLPEQARV